MLQWGKGQLRSQVAHNGKVPAPRRIQCVRLGGGRVKSVWILIADIVVVIAATVVVVIVIVVLVVVVVVCLK